MWARTSACNVRFRAAVSPARSQALHTVSEIFTPSNIAEIGDKHPALVLDTNIVLALWMFRDPALGQLRDLIEAGHCRLYSREDALEELRRVLTYRQFGLDEERQIQLHSDYCRHLMPWAKSPLPDPEERISTLPRCRDSDDQKFLEIAYLSGASHLITRDRALLRLKKHRALKGRFLLISPEHVTDYERRSRLP